MLTNTQISSLKKDLLDRKKELKEHAKINDHYDLQRGHFHEASGELSSIDNHPADEGTELYEREKDIALNQHDDYELENIDKALQAIDNGDYGKCITCGQEIPFERLEALPETRYCVEHSPDQTISTNRPIEEGVLMPPFGKFDNDLQDEAVAYDAEDSWQEVASFGTSEGPSDFYQPQGHYNDVYNESEENIGYVEDYENFVGTDIEGKELKIYPNKQHERYEDELDEEGMMTSFGDLPAFEHDPYVDEDEEK
ncbi:TraR/DksA C4-type zinc finger protein [Bacillus sp. B15-48]|uniref:TraR/DksA C4-type zinc finger protein n=1 Tax=Bacillus sp. B15-48 TaxID=1548601 RepID=UPI00193F5440|nr:TraR/DksA C4-type zinc finger protein [Bacillus sp. B15-48]MBM4761940.1 yteA family sporulation protein [Bacillus sp. B15-48]